MKSYKDVLYVHVMILEIKRTSPHVVIQGVPKKKDILNIYVKSQIINIFLWKLGCSLTTIFVAKCQNIKFVSKIFTE